MTTGSNRGILALALGMAAFGLSGCSSEDQAEPQQVAQTNATLATVLAEQDGLATVANAFKTTGLNSVFDGPGSYTVLAPKDAAFEALGDEAGALMQDDRKALLVAVLRDHIVPGQLDADSVRQAIEAKGGPVSMTTLGDGTLTFALDGDTLTVSGSGDAVPLDDNAAVVASNGVVLPVGGLLKGLPDAASQ